ncbi:gamma carbonic anhydrase family protein [Acrocarpospora catenulata]|uniref:gamma carbonic anhydrase family protein n=1 Tax=Acrocarpospora catenulata TaxID=2836182 RepID=UPI001BDB3F57|nr:gamma carbonic anhydrase family protein [Acrocarpospora catenulata]
MPYIAALDDNAIPSIDPTAWLAPTAVVVGQVTLGPRVNIWYNSVLRADDERIEIGADSNIQDLCCLHADPGYPAILEPRVSVGHKATIHGAHIESGALIGIGAILLNGSRIGAGTLIAAGSVVTPGTHIPSGVLAAGTPARPLRDLTDSDQASFAQTPDRYISKASRHQAAEVHDR